MLLTKWNFERRSPARNRVLIVGNGFDLDCGFDTSYKTFCESFFKKQGMNYEVSQLFGFLKKGFDGSNKNWFNFENEIREYIQRCSLNSSTAKSDKVFFNALTYSLKFHMQMFAYSTDCCELKEYAKYNKDETVFVNPSQVLIRKNSVAYNILTKIVENYSYFTQIISFNYTKIQNVLNGVVGDVFGFDQPQFGEKVKLLPPVQFIHCNFETNNPVLGTEEIILNSKNQEIKIPQEYCFLKKCNQYSKEERQKAIDTIMNADELVIFGHSLGVTDADYFGPLFADMFDKKPSHERKILFITYKGRDAILERIRTFVGHNIVPHHSYKNLSFIDTSIEESHIAYSNLLIDIGG